MRRRIFLGGLAAGAATAATGQFTPAPAPPRLAPPTKEGRYLLASVTASNIIKEWTNRSELMRYDVEDVQALHYAEVAVALGAHRFIGRSQTKAAERAQLAHRWQRAAGLPNTANHVDANVVGVWHMLDGDPAGIGVWLADDQWKETDAEALTSQARFWIDDIWMIGALQAQAYRTTLSRRFIDRAALMARTYLERLQQPNGLFFHGPDAQFHWGRGNGWVAAGLCEVLSVMPSNHQYYEAIVSGYRRMMAALLEHQTKEGLWRQLVDREEAWIETSGSAMFGFAMLRGAYGGLLDRDIYGLAAIRAWDGLGAYLDDRTLLREVCVGTGQSQDMQYYLDRPRVTGDLHGQAPLLWFAAEMQT